MFKTIRNLFLFAVIGAMAASCIKNNNGDEPLVTQQSFSQYMGFVTDKVTGQSSSLSNIGLILYLDYTNTIAKVEITGLKVGEVSYPTITLDNIKWKSEKNGFAEFKAQEITPTANGLLIPSVTNFEGKLVERMIEALAGSSNPTGYWPNLTLSFVMDGKYDILISSSLQIFEGKLESTSESGAKFSTITPVYTATINAEKRILAIRLNSVQFIEAMPAMDIDIPDVPFTISGTDLVINSESIVPTIKDTPYPPYTLTEVKGEIDLEEGLELEFVCNPPQLGKFKVEIDAPFDNK